jgi:hypothetical protein
MARAGGESPQGEERSDEEVFGRSSKSGARRADEGLESSVFYPEDATKT